MTIKCSMCCKKIKKEEIAYANLKILCQKCFKIEINKDKVRRLSYWDKFMGK